MIGFQNHVAVGFKEFFYFIKIDNIRIMNSKEAVRRKKLIYLF